MAIELSEQHAELQQKARDHLWLHFSAMSAPTGRRELPIIERGEGPYLFDTPRQALPRHAGRPVHRADRLLATARSSARSPPSRCAQLPFYTNWTYAHPPAIELADKLAELAPANINRFFFVSGGSEAVEAAWKLARQYHAAPRPADAAQGDRAQARLPRHDDGRALDHRHPGASARPFEPLVPGRPPRRQHEPLPLQVLRRDRASARCSAPTRSPRRSSSRARRRSRW